MDKPTERYTANQLKELAGSYKTSDNPTPDDIAKELKDSSLNKDRTQLKED